MPEGRHSNVELLTPSVDARGAGFGPGVSCSETGPNLCNGPRPANSVFSRAMALAEELSRDANPANANNQVPLENAISITSRPAAPLASWDFLCHFPQLLNAKTSCRKRFLFPGLVWCWGGKCWESGCLVWGEVCPWSWQAAPAAGAVRALFSWPLLIPDTYSGEV